MRLSIALTPAAALSVVFLSAAAHAQSHCDWYAQTALKQQQENEQLKCGLSGPSWMSDINGHLAWCRDVAPDEMKTEAQTREQQLEACAAKKK